MAGDEVEVTVCGRHWWRRFAMKGNRERGKAEGLWSQGESTSAC